LCLSTYIFCFSDFCFFFFFQAEDGIRDFHVTGVQTCALPICWLAFRSRDPFAAEQRNLVLDSTIAAAWVPLMHFNLLPSVLLVRSEERRVGKECRSRWSLYD